MSWVLVCHGLVGTVVEGERDAPVGAYLASFDVDAHDGLGTCTWTTNLDDALHYPSTIAAIQAWRTVSRVRPRRPDGQPNRPLTAFSVEPRRVG